MLYAILIYGSEPRVAQWSKDEEAEVMGRHAELRKDLTEAGHLGPVLCLSREGARIRPAPWLHPAVVAPLTPPTTRD